MPRLSWPSWAPRSMPRLPLTGALLASGLGRRILLLFLLASGLPLLLLGLGSAQMVETLAAVAGRREQARVLQLAALQVHERLLLARDLMRDWPEPDLARPGQAPALPGLGRGFVRALHLDAQGRVDAGDAATRELLDGMTAQRAGTLQVRERNGRALVLMSMASPQGGRWLAELSPSYLWQPMLESAPEALWCVQDVQGVRLHCPAAPSGQGDADAADGAAVRRQLHTSWSLFLDGDFAAPGPGDWRFDLVAPPPPFELAGMTMVRLLSGAVGSTLILVALLSVSLVRRTLGPLQQLRAGVDRLERREGGARVDLRGRDEFGELGQAFNRMAARIDAQFDSLQLLASIDRDIVARREVDELFRRVLVQALLPLECRVMALASVEPGRVPRLLLQWNDRRHLHKVRRSLRVLTPVEHQALLAVDQDGDWAGAAWARALGEGLKVLPLRWQARTLGVLLIGWERAPAPERLGHAAELRDRLAVALAAHQRERELTWQACHDDLTGLLVCFRPDQRGRV
ncbi:HAMP domain-containing protein [Sphaerotilus uruguayifluvii]|uniref:HAMP domain-containing protein n=1 Tax=Sphaerotilus uruguayifluvii TaxID=2735897 RepID=A0ABX2G107_9BURK|nr:HAMP domain-containing protein [Leptothrix sp. C29]NRT55104.1 HAMP domain-containing protein [Leptothrix sp. C29]